MVKKKNKPRSDGSDPPRAVGGLTIIDTTTKKDKTKPEGTAPPVDDSQTYQRESQNKSSERGNNSRRSGNQEDRKGGSYQKDSAWGPRNHDRDRNSGYSRSNFPSNPSWSGNQEPNRETASTWGPRNQERGRNPEYQSLGNNQDRSAERTAVSHPKDGAWGPRKQDRDANRGYSRDNHQNDPSWSENKEAGAWPSGNQERDAYQSRDGPQNDLSWSGNKEGTDSRPTDGSWRSGKQERDGNRGYHSRDDQGWSDKKENKGGGDRGSDSWQKTTRWEDDSTQPKSNSDRSRFQGSNRNNESGDKEFDEFWKYLKGSREKNYVKVFEVEGDLFAMSKEHALAHCVAEDMAMGSGIAVQFSRDFKRRDELLQQREKQGGLAVLEIEERYIYYLVTKRLSTGKPTYHTLWCSLQKLHGHVEEHKVTKLAMPRIGCGLDRLEWSVVKAMIEYVFRNTDIEITVCNFQQAEDGSSSAPVRTSKCAVRNVKYPLVQIDKFTAIVYFGSEDGFATEEIQSLDTKFKILQDYKTAPKAVGEVIRSVRLQNTFILYGFIVKKSHDDPFDFTNLQKCVGSFKKMNTKENASEYVGIEAFLDDGDDLIMTKIVNVLRHSLYGVQIYVCWPGKMTAFMPQERGENYSY